MATKTVLAIPLTGDNTRNAKIEVQNRLEGVLTTSDPVEVGETATELQITFTDTTPDEEVRAALRTLANLADRPGSGIGRGYTFTLGWDDDANPIQREFSR